MKRSDADVGKLLTHATVKMKIDTTTMYRRCVMIRTVFVRLCVHNKTVFFS